PCNMSLRNLLRRTPRTPPALAHVPAEVPVGSAGTHLSLHIFPDVFLGGSPRIMQHVPPEPSPADAADPAGPCARPRRSSGWVGRHAPLPPYLPGCLSRGVAPNHATCPSGTLSGGRRGPRRPLRTSPQKFRLGRPARTSPSISSRMSFSGGRPESCNMSLRNPLRRTPRTPPALAHVPAEVP